MLEAADGVDVTAFLNVTGQVIYAKILESYTQEAFMLSKVSVRLTTPLAQLADGPAGWSYFRRLFACRSCLR